LLGLDRLGNRVGTGGDGVGLFGGFDIKDLGLKRQHEKEPNEKKDKLMGLHRPSGGGKTIYTRKLARNVLGEKVDCQKSKTESQTAQEGEANLPQPEHGAKRGK